MRRKMGRSSEKIKSCMFSRKDVQDLTSLNQGLERSPGGREWASEMVGVVAASTKEGKMSRIRKMEEETSN